MKQFKFAVFAFSLTLALVAGGTSWATRLAGAIVTGEITSPTTNSTQINVGNHVYRIKKGTAAEKELQTFHSGDTVDLEFDSPVLTPGSEVIAISAHRGSAS